MLQFLLAAFATTPLEFTLTSCAAPNSAWSREGYRHAVRRKPKSFLIIPPLLNVTELSISISDLWSYAITASDRESCSASNENLARDFRIRARQKRGGLSGSGFFPERVRKPKTSFAHQGRCSWLWLHKTPIQPAGTAANYFLLNLMTLKERNRGTPRNRSPPLWYKQSLCRVGWSALRVTGTAVT
jgi:hypothetical protein